MKISFELLQPKTEEWVSVANNIEKVSWRAGKHLAEKMRSNQFSDWESVIIGKTVETDLACFCTVSKEDGLLKNKATPFIAYVFVSEKCRGHRVSEKLLEYAEEYLKNQNFKSVYIVSGEVGLYEKYGYKKLENCETVYGDIETLFNKTLFNS